MVRWITGSYIGVGLIGAGLSVSHRRPVRLLGFRYPGSPFVQALTVGTPLSAPPPMLAALAWSAGRGNRQRVRVLGGLFLLGILGEADTWATLRHPFADPLRTAVTSLDVALPAAMLLRA